MAATAINQPKPTENVGVKVVTLATNAEHYKCVRCEGSGYTSYPVQEQLEMIWKLQNDYENIYFENIEMTTKLEYMNVEMEEFLQNIPLGNILPHVEEVCDDKISSSSENLAEVQMNRRKEEEKTVWKEKERELQCQVIHQQKKLISDLMTRRPLVTKEFWGHTSKRWPKSSKKKSPSKAAQKASRSPKPFSIPFCPKPLHLLARKAYLKPPPKLPPLATFSNAPPATNSRLPLKCSSLECENNPSDVQAMKLFADAVERAINTEENAHPYYDGLDQGNDVQGTPWADHPFYDDQGVSGTDQDDDVHGSPWANHPYYDDLEISEAVQDDEDSLGHEESPDDASDASNEDKAEDQGPDSQDDDASDDDATEEVPWEEHPYYDTPDEGDASDGSIAWQDYSTEEEDEVAFEDSPFY